MEPQTSPVKTEMDFPTAISEIMVGKKVTKKEWQNPNVYGELKDGYLMLHKADNKYYQWIISEGDIVGTDYQIV